MLNSGHILALFVWTVAIAFVWIIVQHARNLERENNGKCILNSRKPPSRKRISI